MIFGPQFIHISSAPGGGSGSGTAVVTPAILGLVKTLNNKLFATSADGNIYESSDNGATWSNVSAVSTALHNQHTYSVNEESARLSFSDTSLDLVTFDGTNNVSTVNFTTSSNPLQFLKKIGSRYYASESVSGGNALYYTTDSTLTTGWTSLGTGTASHWIEEGNGVEIRDNGGTVYRSTDGFATSTALYGFATTSAPQLITDGNDNWIRLGGSNTARISTDNGANWTNKYIIEAGGSYPNDIIYQKADTSGNAFYHDGNFYFMNTNYSNNYTPPNRAYKLPVSELSNTYPEATVLYDFNVSSNPALSSYTSVMPLYISYTNHYAYISAYDNNQGSYTPLLFSFQLSQPPTSIQSISTSSSSIYLYGGYQDSNGVHIQTESNEHTTPAESKRLRNLLTGELAFGGGNAVGITPDMDTTNLEVGTKLYGTLNHGNNPAYLYFTMNAFGAIRNTYAHYTINSDASYVGSTASLPHANEYWVTVNTTTSTVEALYTYSGVTENTLKDVTCPFSSGGTVGVNGAFFLDGSGYGTYTDALNANISTGANGDTLYCDAENKYPKVGDRTYQTLTSTTSDSSNAYQRAWVPFLLEGTTSSESVQYAIKFDYASYNNVNQNCAPSITNSYFITEIRDSNGNSITAIPDIASQTVTLASNDAILASKTHAPNNINDRITFASNEHTTPAESKRLWNLGSGTIDQNWQLYPNTSTLAAGTVLYGDSGLTTLAYDPAYFSIQDTRNTYAYYIINSNATNQYQVNPASVDYWVKVDTATSTILHIYADADVTANTLKNVTSNVGSGGTVGPNGAFFFGDGNYGYASYTGALNANISNQDYGHQLYVDSEDKYPKVGDRTYLSPTLNDSGIYQFTNGYWYPFLVEGTTSSGSVSYAVQFGNASYDGGTSNTAPGNSNNEFITEIRDSNGNIVTQIT